MGESGLLSWGFRLLELPRSLKARLDPRLSESPGGHTNRPLVVSADVKIEMEILSQLNGTGFTVDGQVFTELEMGDKIQVEKSDTEVQMIDTGTRTFYGVLREKLNWGGLPNYGRN